MTLRDLLNKILIALLRSNFCSITNSVTMFDRVFVMPFEFAVRVETSCKRPKGAFLPWQIIYRTISSPFWNENLFGKSVTVRGFALFNG